MDLEKPNIDKKVSVPQNSQEGGLGGVLDDLLAQKGSEKGLNLTPKTPLFEGKNTSKTSLALQYEAEVRVIQSKLGDLESIRAQLGLSRRKMCQLLMVDPSAWTRWTQQGRAPHQIYRALQWYMALIEKQPQWHPQNSFNRLGQGSVENEILLLKKELQKLKASMETTSSLNKEYLFTAVVLFLGGLALGYWI